MESEFKFFSIILLLGITQGLFLALALLHTRVGNVIAHRILATITLIFVFDLCGEFLYQTNYYYELAWLIWVDDPFEFLYGPLILFYVYALTRPENFRLKRTQWPHFLPFVLAILLSAPFYTLDAVEKVQFVYQENIYQESEHMLLAFLGQFLLVWLFIIQTGIYLALGSHKLVQHAHKIKETFSYTEKISLAWLRNFFMFLIALYLLFVMEQLSSNALGFGYMIKQILYCLTVFMFYFMGVMGLRQPLIFSNINTGINQIEFGEIPRSISISPKTYIDSHDKYNTSSLDTVNSQLLLRELITYMESEKPYLENQLSLPQLALKLNISTNYLSQIINEQLNKNFFDFVNGYRVEEAKHYLSDPLYGQTKILTIALDSGFNSKSAFYTAFKKYTQMSPNQYKKLFSSGQ